MESTLSLIIKSTRKCNLRCSYCHDWRSRGDTIPFDVLANLIAKALQPNKYRVVNFIWHGGEPLLLGIEFFRKALTLQQTFINKNQYVINSIQTNGTLLNEEWCQFFKRNQFQVGVSIDGPKEMHNRNRSYASGKGSFDDVVLALRMLEEFEIPYGVLLVLNDSTRVLKAEDIFRFIADDLNVKSFSFLPAVPDNIVGEKSGERETTDYFPMEDYEDFMIEIFDHWFSLDDPEVSVREIDGIVRSILSGNPQVCTLAGGCIGSNYHIEANGNVYHCDKYVGDQDYNVGNILDDDFSMIMASDKMENLLEKERANLERLSSCKYFHICNGGCPHDRYISSKYRSDFTGECCGQSRLISHVATAMSKEVGQQNMALLGHTELS